MSEQIRSTKQLIPDGLAGYGKAIVAFVYSVVAALLLVLPTDGGFGDLTTAQWLGVAALVLGPGGVLGVANKVKPTPPAPVLPSDEDDEPGKHAAPEDGAEGATVAVRPLGKYMGG